MKNKYSLLIIAASLLFCCSACLKDSGNTGRLSNTSIVGKWNITSDSTFAGVGLGNHAVNYEGQAGDYFDFRTDGNVYIKEGIVLDTLSYKLVSSNAIIISSFGVTLNGVPETSHIAAFTTHQLVIDAPEILTPGGVFGRKVSLAR